MPKFFVDVMKITTVRHSSLVWLVGCLTVVTAFLSANEAQESSNPPLYEQLLSSDLIPIGQIKNGRITIDRFDFELTDGELYTISPVEDQIAIVVFLGEGVVRSYPPDGVEHQQLEKFLDDEDMLEETFERFVFWFSDDTGIQLREQVENITAENLDRAKDLLQDRRKNLLERQLINPDSRLLVDLLSLQRPKETQSPRKFFHAQIDSRDNGWLSINIEPLEREEVQIIRFDRRRNTHDVWMGFHALSDFESATRSAVFDGFPRNPQVEGKLSGGDGDDWNALDLGIPPRPLQPEQEGWTRQVRVLRTDVDLALEGNGDAKASAALLFEAHQPLDAIRLRLSPVLKVTDVRWQSSVPANSDNVHDITLLAGNPPSPDTPVELTGDALNFVQATHDRRLAEDLHEPSVTIVLPRVVAPTERFIIKLSYEGELIDYRRDGRTYVLKDALNWMPSHLHNRGTPGTRLSLTYRVPERFRVASGASLVDEQIIDGTRIMRWVSENPVAGMSFNLGRFNISTVERDTPPHITVYADRTHRGFSPSIREKTLDDLAGAIQTYTDYFGPYPFESLLVTETPTYNGLAFPGLVLLSFQAFGNLHTGEAELFRAHEVAHQWWGVSVPFENYRDQWLSEGFSQYSAALYTLKGLEREDQFLDMLDAWRLDVLGEVNIGQAYGKNYGFRPEVIRRSDGHKSGPLSIGYRLRTAETPLDYRILVYEKGAFVLHMLRMMLTELETGDDEPFRKLMRNFFREHLFSSATTTAFEMAVTEAFGKPMDWFFDQWVHGVDIPTYRPELEVSPLTDTADPFLLHGRVQQENVPDGFRMPVPIVIRFEDRPPLTHRLWVDANTVDIEIPLPAQPSEILFNYQHGVLAHIR